MRLNTSVVATSAGYELNATAVRSEKLVDLQHIPQYVWVDDTHVHAEEKMEEQVVPERSDVFERLPGEIERFPRKAMQKSIVWSWMVLTAERQQTAAAMARYLGDRGKTKPIHDIPTMEPTRLGRRTACG